jgi:hypothetical protein
LLSALEGAKGPQAAILGQTVLELVDQLFPDGAASLQSDARPDLQVGRQQITELLELSASRFGRHRRREVIEALALSADCENATLKRILEDPLHPAFLVLMEVLSKSARERILRLVLSYLYKPKAPSAVLSVVGKRADPEFARLLLAEIARGTPKAMVRNLKRVSAVAWAHGQGSLLDHLDGALQRAALRLVLLCGVSRASAFEVVKHLLLHGEPEERRAAAEALKEFQGAEANALTLEALDDEDPNVQAEALVQLRGRGIAGAMARVVGMLDSPHAVVRSAARACLTEFTFPRFLATYEGLDPAARQSTGEIVKKVDPQTVPLLEAEMTSRARTRQLRALEIAKMLDLAESVEGMIVRLLQDEDHGVRADAASTLRSCRSRTSRDALNAALADRNPLVRDAARKSLVERSRQ